MMTGHCDAHVASPAVARCGTCHEAICSECCANLVTPDGRLCWFCALELDAGSQKRRFWHRRQNPLLTPSPVPLRSWKN
jgi:hypothetical protein